MRAILRFVLFVVILIPLFIGGKVAAQQINSIPSKNSVGDWDSLTPSQSPPYQGGEVWGSSPVSDPLSISPLPRGRGIPGSSPYQGEAGEGSQKNKTLFWLGGCTPEPAEKQGFNPFSPDAPGYNPGARNREPIGSSPWRGEDAGGSEKKILDSCFRRNDDHQSKAQQLINWSTPEIVTGFKRDLTDFTPFITPDGLTLYFSSEREKNIGIFDIYAATRSRRKEDFSPPYNLGGNINAPDAQNLMATLTGDELEMFFVRNTGGGINGNDIYHATRERQHCSFQPAQPVEEINTAGADFYPWITPDGLTLYFAGNRAGSREMDIWCAGRATRATPFDSPRLVSGVNSRADDFAFSLSADGSLAYLVSRRGDFITANIYTAVADATPGEFQEPVLIPILDGDRFDSSPTVTADGTELYFFSNRDNQLFRYSLWKVTSRPRLPIPQDVPRLWILDGRGRGYMIY